MFKTKATTSLNNVKHFSQQIVEKWKPMIFPYI